MRCVWHVNVQLFVAATADTLPCGSCVAWHCCRCMVTMNATSPSLLLALALALAHAFTLALMQLRERYLPTTIRGDLDSVRPEVLAFYRQRGVLVEDLSGAE